MENIFAILKASNGIFLNLSERNDSPDSERDGHISYIGIERDRYNLRNDMIRILSDFGKAAHDAKHKQSPIWQ
jgi:hypothetical protein